MADFNKRQKQLIMILSVSVIAFSLVVFLIPFKKGLTFWIAYISEIIAVVLQIPVFKLAFDNAGELKSKVLGFPVFRVGYIYLGIQTAVSIILFALGASVSSFPVWISLVLCVIILAAALICSMGADIAREEVTKIEQGQVKNTKIMLNLRNIITEISDSATNAELQSKLMSLEEDFRFSDPVSSDATADIESELLSMAEQLKTKAEDNTITEQDINALKRKLAQRNTLCKSNKK